ncbi:MAG: hypothetical protein HC837_18525 [Chloroflexaceae bacterium]|nr:hypothetical protein [Chloroflexaceae bacterium]
MSTTALPTTLEEALQKRGIILMHHTATDALYETLKAQTINRLRTG